MHRSYPLVYRLIELTLILPVATASVERVFSAMSIIKTDLRNKMGDEWLNDLMICYTEKEIFRSISNEKIMKRFEEMKERRMLIPQKIVVCFITISFFILEVNICTVTNLFFIIHRSLLQKNDVCCNGTVTCHYHLLHLVRTNSNRNFYSSSM